ncbi:MAG: extracellular solute-binding protein [Armatimonadota bacterium]|nr:extracellular solute-binding protein [Armatimonadota bacterium]
MKTLLTIVCAAAVLLGAVVAPGQQAVRAAPAVTILAQSHFVPAFEDELKREVRMWSQRRGIAASVDFVSTAEMNAKLAAEVETKSGHDIVALRNYDAALYQDVLADLTDVANEVGSAYGGWIDLGKEISVFGGQWKAVPWYHQSFVAVYRTDFFADIGLDRRKVHEMTWDQLLVAARALAEKRHPVGFPISQTNDSDLILYPLLWAFGASTVDKAGRVIINSPQTIRAVEFVKQLAQHMPKDVLGWDDSGNNRFVLSGVGSLTFNPPSIYAVALKENPPLALALDHAPVPAGPAGRFRSTGTYAFGIWKFKQSPEAKDLIRFLLQRDNYRAQVASSEGYNQPFLKDYRSFPLWRARTALNAYEPVPEQLHLQGWPGPASAAAQRAWSLHIVPVMFAKAVAGVPTLEAVRWAEDQLKQLYGR